MHTKYTKYSNLMDYDVLIKLGHSKIKSWVLAKNRDEWFFWGAIWLVIICLGATAFFTSKTMNPGKSWDDSIGYVLMTVVSLVLAVVFAVTAAEIKYLSNCARKEYLFLWALLSPQDCDEHGQPRLSPGMTFEITYNRTPTSMISLVRSELSNCLHDRVPVQTFIAVYHAFENIRGQIFGEEHTDLLKSFRLAYLTATMRLPSPKATTVT